MDDDDNQGPDLTAYSNVECVYGEIYTSNQTGSSYLMVFKQNYPQAYYLFSLFMTYVLPYAPRFFAIFAGYFFVQTSRLLYLSGKRVARLACRLVAAVYGKAERTYRRCEWWLETEYANALRRAKELRTEYPDAAPVREEWIRVARALFVEAGIWGFGVPLCVWVLVRAVRAGGFWAARVLLRVVLERVKDYGVEWSWGVWFLDYAESFNLVAKIQLLGAALEPAWLWTWIWRMVVVDTVRSVVYLSLVLGSYYINQAPQLLHSVPFSLLRGLRHKHHFSLYDSTNRGLRMATVLYFLQTGTMPWLYIFARALYFAADFKFGEGRTPTVGAVQFYIWRLPLPRVLRFLWEYLLPEKRKLLSAKRTAKHYISTAIFYLERLLQSLGIPTLPFLPSPDAKTHRKILLRAQQAHPTRTPIRGTRTLAWSTNMLATINDRLGADALLWQQIGDRPVELHRSCFLATDLSWFARNTRDFVKTVHWNFNIVAGALEVFNGFGTLAEPPDLVNRKLVKHLAYEKANAVWTYAVRVREPIEIRPAIALLESATARRSCFEFKETEVEMGRTQFRDCYAVGVERKKYKPEFEVGKEEPVGDVEGWEDGEEEGRYVQRDRHLVKLLTISVDKFCAVTFHILDMLENPTEDTIDCMRFLFIFLFDPSKIKLWHDLAPAWEALEATFDHIFRWEIIPGYCFWEQRNFHGEFDIETHRRGDYHPFWRDSGALVENRADPNNQPKYNVPYEPMEKSPAVRIPEGQYEDMPWGEFFLRSFPFGCMWREIGSVDVKEGKARLPPEFDMQIAQFIRLGRLENPIPVPYHPGTCGAPHIFMDRRFRQLKERFFVEYHGDNMIERVPAYKQVGPEGFYDRRCSTRARFLQIPNTGFRLRERGSPCPLGFHTSDVDDGGLTCPCHTSNLDITTIMDFAVEQYDVLSDPNAGPADFTFDSLANTMWRKDRIKWSTQRPRLSLYELAQCFLAGSPYMPVASQLVARHRPEPELKFKRYDNAVEREKKVTRYEEDLRTYQRQQEVFDRYEHRTEDFEKDDQALTYVFGSVLVLAVISRELLTCEDAYALGQKLAYYRNGGCDIAPYQIENALYRPQRMPLMFHDRLGAIPEQQRPLVPLREDAMMVASMNPVEDDIYYYRHLLPGRIVAEHYLGLLRGNAEDGPIYLTPVAYATRANMEYAVPDEKKYWIRSVETGERVQAQTSGAEEECGYTMNEELRKKLQLMSYNQNRLLKKEEAVELPECYPRAQDILAMDLAAAFFAQELDYLDAAPTGEESYIKYQMVFFRLWISQSLHFNVRKHTHVDASLAWEFLAEGKFPFYDAKQLPKDIGSFLGPGRGYNDILYSGGTYRDDATYRTMANTLLHFLILEVSRLEQRDRERSQDAAGKAIFENAMLYRKETGKSIWDKLPDVYAHENITYEAPFWFKRLQAYAAVTFRYELPLAFSPSEEDRYPTLMWRNYVAETGVTDTQQLIDLLAAEFVRYDRIGRLQLELAEAMPSLVEKELRWSVVWLKSSINSVQILNFRRHLTLWFVGALLLECNYYLAFFYVPKVEYSPTHWSAFYMPKVEYSPTHWSAFYNAPVFLLIHIVLIFVGRLLYTCEQRQTPFYSHLMSTADLLASDKHNPLRNFGHFLKRKLQDPTEQLFTSQKEYHDKAEAEKQMKGLQARSWTRPYWIDSLLLVEPEPRPLRPEHARIADPTAKFALAAFRLFEENPVFTTAGLEVFERRLHASALNLAAQGCPEFVLPWIWPPQPSGEWARRWTPLTIWDARKRAFERRTLPRLGQNTEDTFDSVDYAKKQKELDDKKQRREYPLHKTLQAEIMWNGRLERNAQATLDETTGTLARRERIKLRYRINVDKRARQKGIEIGVMLLSAGCTVEEIRARANSSPPIEKMFEGLEAEFTLKELKNAVEFNVSYVVADIEETLLAKYFDDIKTVLLSFDVIEEVLNDISASTLDAQQDLQVTEGEVEIDVAAIIASMSPESFSSPKKAMSSSTVESSPLSKIFSSPIKLADSISSASSTASLIGQEVLELCKATPLISEDIRRRMFEEAEMREEQARQQRPYFEAAELLVSEHLVPAARAIYYYSSLIERKYIDPSAPPTADQARKVLPEEAVDEITEVVISAAAQIGQTDPGVVYFFVERMLRALCEIWQSTYVENGPEDNSDVLGHFAKLAGAESGATLGGVKEPVTTARDELEEEEGDEKLHAAERFVSAQLGNAAGAIVRYGARNLVAVQDRIDISTPPSAQKARDLLDDIVLGAIKAFFVNAEPGTDPKSATVFIDELLRTLCEIWQKHYASIEKGGSILEPFQKLHDLHLSREKVKTALSGLRQIESLGVKWKETEKATLTPPSPPEEREEKAAREARAYEIILEKYRSRIRRQEEDLKKLGLGKWTVKRG